MKNKSLLTKAKEVLTAEEFMLFELMNTQYLVPFVKGPSGIGKTARFESIAKKMDFVYWDLRTVTMDETDAGLYPIARDTKVIVNGEELDICELKHAAPVWVTSALKDTSKCHIFVFEELNRAPQAIRNAFMGIVLERRVGWNLKFGENVFMAATGNLGDRDGTEVEELDFAQRDRFIHIEIKPELGQWIADFAKENVHKDIIKFLEHKPGHFYPDIKEQDNDCVLTPRKWTGFSNYLVANTENGLNSNVDEYIGLLDRGGKFYLGGRYAEFRTFVMEGRNLTVKDVLAGNRVKDYTRIPRDNKAEVLYELKGLTFESLKQKECDNVQVFLETLRGEDDDHLSGFIYEAFHKIQKDNAYKSKSEVMKNKFANMIWNAFKKELDYVKENSSKAKAAAA